MKCSKCGNSMSKGIKFCQNCGTKIKQENKLEPKGKTKVPIHVVYIFLSLAFIFIFFLGLMTANTYCKGDTGVRFSENGICRSDEVSTFSLGHIIGLLISLGIFIPILSLIILVTNVKKKKYGYELYASIAGVLIMPVVFLGLEEHGLKTLGLLVLPILMLLFSILDAKTRHREMV